MARNGNTYEKMRREMEKKRKADEKRARKQVKKEDQEEEEPTIEVAEVDADGSVVVRTIPAEKKE